VTRNNPDVAVLITEIGGTVGDMEGLLFIEALRQFALEVGKDNVCFIHVTLLPLIKAAGEVKTKPTQQSVAKLRELGIQPDIIICRTESDLSDDNRRKIAMFCNVEARNVVAFRDVAHTIYECPLDLRRDKIDRLVVDRIGLGHTPPPTLEEWERFVQRIIHPKGKVTIAIAGKYGLLDAYKSIYESLVHAGALHNTKVKIVRVDTEDIEQRGAEEFLGGVDGVLIPGGFGERGIEGKVLAVQYAREQRIPFFGICLGMQVAVIEFARNVCRLKDANSTELDTATPHPVIDLQEEQKKVEGKGGNMRLGACESVLIAGTLAYQLYGGVNSIRERHRHRYEFNSDYRERMEENGMVLSSFSAKEGLVEIVELPDHPFFIGAQFHPEFQSKPNHPHPIFAGFIKAAMDYAKK
jgi:CTP synthase